jgi:hypothetical protein
MELKFSLLCLQNFLIRTCYEPAETRPFAKYCFYLFHMFLIMNLIPILFLNSIQRLVFVMETLCPGYTVGTKVWNTI